MLRLVSVLAVLMPCGLMSRCGMMFMKLLGAIGPLEFMALAGDPEPGNGHSKDR